MVQVLGRLALSLGLFAVAGISGLLAQYLSYDKVFLIGLIVPLVSISGADPLNLVGILTPGPRLSALTGNRVLYRNGLPVALLAGGAVQFLEELDATSEWQARKALLRGAVPASMIDLA